jgi:bacillithiol biosynthesis deacetylase BshB1
VRVAVDLLVFGPHPDDIEIGLGGTVARHVALGRRVGLCDLTVGELGSNGTPDERIAEAEEARRVLGAEWRDNLRLPDGRLGPDEHQVRRVVDVIRRACPRVIAAPHDHDRHPDHVGASHLVARASFVAGLRRYETGAGPWRPEWICYYFINDADRPAFVVDVSRYYDVKRRALACHATQFAPTSATSVETRLTSSRFRQLVESRDAQFGAMAGVAYAEGIVVREPIVRGTLFKERDQDSAGAGEWNPLSAAEDEWPPWGGSGGQA